MEIMLWIIGILAGVELFVIVAFFLRPLFKKDPSGTRREPKVIYVPQPQKPSFSRLEIINDVTKLPDENISVKVRKDAPQLPATLKYKNKGYAMLYAADEGMLVIAKLPKDFANTVAYSHPATNRAVFPKGAHWFSVPIDSTFKDKAEIHEILNTAREFVANPPPRAKKQV